MKIGFSPDLNAGYRRTAVIRRVVVERTESPICDTPPRFSMAA